MGVDADFTFKTNKLATMRVSVTSKGVVLKTEGGKNAQHGKTYSVDFADVGKVSLHAYERKKIKTGSLAFYPVNGERVVLVGTSGGPIGASEADLDGYYAAAQAVLTAYAIARPEARVMLGRDTASTIGAMIGLSISLGAGVLAALLMSGGDSFAFGAGAVAAAVAMVIIGYSRLGVGKRPHLVPVNSAIVRIADRSVARPTAT